MNPYFYEIIEDYQLSESQEEKEEILNDFYTSLWSCPNQRRTCTRTIRFHVRKDLKETEIGSIFDRYSRIEYKGCRSTTAKTDYLYLLRQKINNLYTRYFDSEIILNPDYMYLIKTPKRLYLSWLSGTELSAEELTLSLEAAMSEALMKKEQYQKQKMILSFSDYKHLIEGFLRKCFDHCCQIEELENRSHPACCYDFVAEDNFYIRYFCRCLEGYLKDFQKQYYGIRRRRNMVYKRCQVCGKMIEKTGNRRKYCPSCAAAVKKAQNRSYLKNQENRNSA